MGLGVGGRRSRCLHRSTVQILDETVEGKVSHRRYLFSRLGTHPFPTDPFRGTPDWSVLVGGDGRPEWKKDDGPRSYADDVDHWSPLYLLPGTLFPVLSFLPVSDQDHWYLTGLVRDCRPGSEKMFFFLLGETLSSGT